MHWRAVYFNRKRAECYFFDSLVSEPTDDVMRGIKMIMRKIDDPLYFKFKINRIKLQADNSATCGAFALRFIADMCSNPDSMDGPDWTGNGRPAGCSSVCPIHNNAVCQYGLAAGVARSLADYALASLYR